MDMPKPRAWIDLDELLATLGERHRPRLAALGLADVRPLVVVPDSSEPVAVLLTDDRRADETLAVLLGDDALRDALDAATLDAHRYADVRWPLDAIVAWMRASGLTDLIPPTWPQAEPTATTPSSLAASDGLRSADDLRRWLGAKRDADVTRFLRKHGIDYRLGVGGRPVTTDAAINAALCVDDGGEADAFDFTARS